MKPSYSYETPLVYSKIYAGRSYHMDNYPMRVDQYNTFTALRLQY